MRREFLLAAAAFAASAAWGQLTPLDPDWREAEVPSPPALRTTGLVAVEIDGRSELRFGVDPQSVAIGQDGVVRYVMVASSNSGAINASYEGLKCDRAEYRIYARNSGGGWQKVTMQWRSMFEGAEAKRVRHIARAGACRNKAPNDSAAQVVRDLAAPMDRKFGSSGAP